GQLLQVIGAFLLGRKPPIRAHSTCMECKARGNVCVTVAHGTPCLGPVTHAGCGALCPTYHRGCYGCFGPSDAARPAALVRDLLERGVERPELYRLLSNFNAAAEPFRTEAERHDGQD
ncbi:MAG: oxidoreductase, partial [Myxococcales bacterium]|nr:oxidoreductase [Myxococcales bacterium]